MRGREHPSRINERAPAQYGSVVGKGDFQPHEERKLSGLYVVAPNDGNGVRGRYRAAIWPGLRGMLDGISVGRASHRPTDGRLASVGAMVLKGCNSTG